MQYIKLKKLGNPCDMQWKIRESAKEALCSITDEENLLLHRKSCKDAYLIVYWIPTRGFVGKNLEHCIEKQ